MDQKVLRRKINVFTAIVVAVFLVLGFRLAYLQLLEMDRFRTLARENSVRLIPIEAPRGEIFDRHGKKIVGNRPLYAVSLVNLDLKREELARVVKRLALLLGMPEQEIWARVNDEKLRRYEPVYIARNVSLDVITRIEERREELPGVIIDIQPQRDYPYGSLLAHVLGYTREIQPAQLERHKDEGYRMGDMYGQAGLENTYERYLRGEKGAWQVEVDAWARPVRYLGVKNPVPGNDLYLTIDLELQKTAEEALAKSIQAVQKGGYPQARAGAAVMLDVRTGEVLAMASYPSYNPADLARDLTPAEVQKIFSSPDQILLNRAIQAVYPPGSTFKMVVAAAALETGTISEDFAIWDTGRFYLGRLYTDWKPGGHGRVDLLRAIQVSCDTYFWTVGRMVGPEAIAKFARELGLGKATGIDIPGERSGAVPTREYKYKVVKQQLDQRFGPEFRAVEDRYRKLIARAATPEEKARLERERDRERARIQAQYDRYAWELEWRDYDTLNLSIGQGYNEYTPLQLANYVAAIANGGTVYRPYLVKKIVSPTGQTVATFEPRVVHRANISPATLATIRAGMGKVCQPGGTAYGVFYDFPRAVAGKTGTAEVFGKDNHGIYVAFAPLDKPEVAIAVVVEHGGHGSSAAAPVARALLEKYFGVEPRPVPLGPPTE
ncbi:MAG: penicillin-binding protein 2 [Bacillota bacterium]